MTAWYAIIDFWDLRKIKEKYQKKLPFDIEPTMNIEMSLRSYFTFPDVIQYHFLQYSSPNELSMFESFILVATFDAIIVVFGTPFLGLFFPVTIVSFFVLVLEVSFKFVYWLLSEIVK